LPISNVTGPVECADRIAVASLTSVSALQVEESVQAAIAVVAHHVWFAFTLSADLITLEGTRRKLQSSAAEALTRPAIAFIKGQSVTKESGQAGVATVSGSVVDTLETFARRSVAIAHSVGIDVSVAIARLARSSGTETALGITEIAIAAQFASRAGVTDRTFEANDSFVGQFDTSATVGTRARIAIVGRSLKSVAVKSPGASLAIVACRVVLANAAAAFGVANIGVSVAIARDAASKRTAVGGFVTESRSAGFAKLADVTFRAIAAFNPVGR
jgi:hypothetical protein